MMSTMSGLITETQPTEIRILVTYKRYNTSAKIKNIALMVIASSIIDMISHLPYALSFAINYSNNYLLSNDVSIMSLLLSLAFDLLVYYLFNRSVKRILRVYLKIICDCVRLTYRKASILFNFQLRFFK